MYITGLFMLKTSFHYISVPDDSGVVVGDFIIVSTPDFPQEVVKVLNVHAPEASDNRSIDDSFVFSRKVSEEDLSRIHAYVALSAESRKVFGEKIIFHGLDMRPVGVYFTFDGQGMYFHFVAKERIDFRELVKDLARIFKKKIFLYQIGPRDRARLQDGYGTCGQRLCCSSFLFKPPSVTMEAVRAQNLYYKDREKLMGLCGRLKCCLNYEMDHYKELKANMPEVGSRVHLHDKGNTVYRVISQSILDQQLRVVADGAFDVTTIPLKDIREVIESAKPEAAEALAASLKDIAD